MGRGHVGHLFEPTVRYLSQKEISYSFKNLKIIFNNWILTLIDSVWIIWTPHQIYTFYVDYIAKPKQSIWIYFYSV